MKLRLSLSMAAAMMASAVSDAVAQETCDEGWVPIYWLESVGLLNEPWRDTYVPPSIRGKAVTALIVNMSIYWPTCEEAETVDSWKLLADPPPG